MSMPVYSTNMRLKFPVVALLLEIITIIVYAVFVVYDDGKGQHSSHHDTENKTYEGSPMSLYPSKYPYILHTASERILQLTRDR